MNFTKIDNSLAVEGFVLVKNCEKKNAKNGSMYLDMVLADKDDEIIAKLWGYDESVEKPEVNTLVKVRGTLQEYNGKDQLIVQRIRNVVEGDNVSVSDFVKSADITGEETPRARLKLQPEAYWQPVFFCPKQD